MQVLTYCTRSGKDVIRSYLEGLSTHEKIEGYYILEKLEDVGFDALQTLNTRQIDGKLWEIKFWRHNRLYYVIYHKESVYIVHACKKQKNKAENRDIQCAIERAKEALGVK